MLKFWRNPEFVRHLRAELRFARAVTVAAVVLVLCLLVGLACYSDTLHNLDGASFKAYAGADTLAARDRIIQQGWLHFFKWLLILQGGVLTLWSLLSCAQSVTGERDRKTWDFQRITRLTSAELMIGKLLGEPVLAYFAVLCALPLTVVAGLAAGLPLGGIVASYLTLLAAALFLGIVGLWLSTVLESRSRGVGVLGALGTFVFFMGSENLRRSGLPGLAAFSPITGISHQFGDFNTLPLLFGRAVPWLAMTLAIYAMFGAWLTLMVLRNLKRDYDHLRLLSRWQAVGAAAFVNFLVYALLKPYTLGPGGFGDARAVLEMVLAVNWLALFLLGLATLTPQERLKVWSRNRQAGKATLFSDEGMAWPWLALSAGIAYLMLLWGMTAWSAALPAPPGLLSAAFVQMMVPLIFVTRDILFVQWCRLTHMRQPVLKGILFIGLYYVASAVFTLMAWTSSEQNGKRVLELLTPGGVFDTGIAGLQIPGAVYADMALQGVLALALLLAIQSRLQRPAKPGAMAEAMGD